MLNISHIRLKQIFFLYVKSLLHSTDASPTLEFWSNLSDQIDRAGGPWLDPPADRVPPDESSLRDRTFRYCDSSFLLAAAITNQKTGRGRRSWEYLRHANKMELRRYSQSVAISVNESLAAEAEVAARSLLQRDSLLPLSLQPLFVTGMPSAGLAELVALLDSHSNILAMAANPQYFSLLEGSTNSAIMNSVAGASLEQLRNLVFAHSSWHALHENIDDSTPAEVRDQVDAALRSIIERINAVRSDVDKTHVILAQHATRTDITFAARGARSQMRQYEDIKFIVDYDQTHFMNLPLLHSLYPGTVLINLVSDPLQLVYPLCCSYLHG